MLYHKVHFSLSVHYSGMLSTERAIKMTDRVRLNVLKGLQLTLILMLNGQMVNVFNIFSFFSILLIKYHIEFQNRTTYRTERKKTATPSKNVINSPFHIKGIQPISLKIEFDRRFFHFRIFLLFSEKNRRRKKRIK